MTDFVLDFTYCDFEYGLCGWTQDTNDDMQWTLQSSLIGSHLTVHFVPNEISFSGSLAFFIVIVDRSIKTDQYNLDNSTAI